MFLKTSVPRDYLILESGDDPNSSGATFSRCERYRYHLWRRWGSGKIITYMMCNPSTADAFMVDPTVRKCIHFAKRDGYAGVDVLNIFALRSTDPRALICEDPVGPFNDDFIAAVKGVVCIAWGGVGSKVKGNKGRPDYVVGLLSGKSDVELVCVGRNGDGTPRHPCYLSNDTQFVPW